MDDQRKLREYMKEVGPIKPGLTGAHLTEDEAIDFYYHRLESGQHDQVNEHIAGCIECFTLIENVRDFFDEPEESTGGISEIESTRHWLNFKRALLNQPEIVSQDVADDSSGGGASTPSKFRFPLQAAAGFALLASIGWVIWNSVDGPSDALDSDRTAQVQAPERASSPTRTVSFEEPKKTDAQAPAPSANSASDAKPAAALKTRAREVDQEIEIEPVVVMKSAGEEKVASVKIDPAATRFRLKLGSAGMDVDVESNYTLDIRKFTDNKPGELKNSKSIKPSKEGLDFKAFIIPISAEKLPPGEYVLIIKDKKRIEIGRYRLNLDK